MIQSDKSNPELWTGLAISRSGRTVQTAQRCHEKANLLSNPQPVDPLDALMDSEEPQPSPSAIETPSEQSEFNSLFQHQLRLQWSRQQVEITWSSNLYRHRHPQALIRKSCIGISTGTYSKPTQYHGRARWFSTTKPYWT